MNVETNELYDLSKMTDKEKAKLMDNPNVRLVPDKFQREAVSLLGRKKKVKVSVTGNNLGAWARKVRANNGIKLKQDS